MKSINYAITLATLVFAVTPAHADADKDWRTIPFAVIAQGNLSGVKHQMDVVIRDQMEFEMLWRHHSEGTPVADPMPKVDFATEVVAGVFLGNTPNCGYDVEVRRVRDYATHTQVKTRVTVQSPQVILCLMLTQPFELVKFPRDMYKPIVFKGQVVEKQP